VGLVLVTAVLYWAQKVLIPVALAVLLAFILTPAVAALQRRGLGRLTSTIIVVTLAFLLLGAVGWVISQQVGALVSRLPRYQKEMVKKVQGLQGVGQGGIIGNVYAAATDIAKILFFVFIVLAVLSFLGGAFRGAPPPV